MEKKTIKQKIGVFIHKHGPFNARVIRIFRSEINSVLINLIFYLSPVTWIKKRKINKLSSINLNLGCGEFGIVSDEWINIDINKYHKCVTFAYDIRKKIPFRSNSIDKIFSEHVVEHFEMREDIPRFFLKHIEYLSQEAELE